MASSVEAWAGDASAIAMIAMVAASSWRMWDG
jgi:hypothetical protein